ncbi:MAG TPA: EAL domain-containing protein [Pseudomonadales bacterium]|nr:EAL domain-containing protein [Pseudomonadales bacterium]
MSQSETIRLLIINDDANEVERLLSMLRNSGRNSRAQHVPSIEGLEKLLGDQAWDLLLAVDTAKSCDPKLALRTIKKLDKDIPVIFLTEADIDEFNIALIDGLKAGARDVVILDDDQHLLMTMTRELANLQERRERRKADRKLKESERRCQQLLDSSRDAIAYVEDGMFLYANQSFAERFGYKETDDIITMPVIDIIAKSDQDNYKNFMKAFKLSEDGEKELSIKGTRSDKSEFEIDIAVTHAIYENDPCVQLLVAGKYEAHTGEVAAEIKKANNLDALTGVYNRVYMSNALAGAIRDAAEHDKYRSLHIISIDLYDPEMRSSLGISGRDAAITDIAAHLKTLVGNDGTLGRIADDEFALLTNGTDEEQQTRHAKDICKQVADHIYKAGAKTTQITVTIGICPITEKVTTQDQVFERAHSACEEIRKAGKNGVGNGAKYYLPKLSDANTENNTIVTEIIERAISKEGFQLTYQPIISLRGEADEHYEVLLKMLPDDSGTTLAYDEIFRALATNETLGKKLDRWTLINAAKSLAARRSDGSSTNMFINISAASLRDDSLAGWLSVALTTANLPASALILQFDETDASNYLTQTKNFCDAMHEIGVRCCINHFGCSLNPFKTLSHFDVDMVKVDGSFTSDIQHKNESPDTLKNLLKEINDNYKQSIVPQVENATVLATLWQSGAHFIQGQYVQAPSDKMDFVFNEE